MIEPNFTLADLEAAPVGSILRDKDGDWRMISTPDEWLTPDWHFKGAAEAFSYAKRDGYGPWSLHLPESADPAEGWEECEPGDLVKGSEVRAVLGDSVLVGVLFETASFWVEIKVHGSESNNYLGRHGDWKFFRRPKPARKLPTGAGAVVRGNGRMFARQEHDNNPWYEIGAPRWCSTAKVFEIVGHEFEVLFEGVEL